MQYILRDAASEDLNFIFNSYLKSYHDNAPVKFVAPTLYYKHQSKELEFLIRHAKCAIACFPEDGSEIISWVLYEYFADNLILHYVYTKQPSRRLGIAKDIITTLLGPRKLIIATHAPDEFTRLRKKLPVKTIYDPYFIQDKKLRDSE